MKISKLLPQAVTRAAGRQSFRLQKNAPNMMFAAGLVGSVASTVLACRATLKIEAVLDEAKQDIDNVKQAHVDIGLQRRDVAYAYVRAGEMVVRPYLPAVVVGVASIGLLTKSHMMLNERNAALVAAYTALEKGFAQYRARVQEEIGEEKEQEIFLGVEEGTVMVDGKKLKVHEYTADRPSVHARLFDEYNPEWKKDAEYNRLFIQCQQKYVNDLLQARGYVFLNDVYDALRIERSQAGQFVGWVLDAEGSDNYIDFGIFQPRNREFVNGQERSILLDFNVQGVIIDKI